MNFLAKEFIKFFFLKVIKANTKESIETLVEGQREIAEFCAEGFQEVEKMMTEHAQVTDDLSARIGKLENDNKLAS